MYKVIVLSDSRNKKGFQMDEVSWKSFILLPSLCSLINTILACRRKTPYSVYICYISIYYRVYYDETIFKENKNYVSLQSLKDAGVINASYDKENKIAIITSK